MWILIIFMAGASVEHISFADELSCINAKNAVNEVAYFAIKPICVPYRVYE